MAVESSYANIADLNPAWPTVTDPVSEGDDHLRGIKSALQGNVQGSGTETVLYNGSVNKALGAALRTKAQGVDVLDTAPGGVAPAITLRGQAGTALAALLHATGATSISAQFLGDNLVLDVVTASGVRRGVMVRGADGLVELYAAGSVVVVTDAQGLTLNAPVPRLSLGAVGQLVVSGVDLVASAAGAGTVALAGPNAISHLQTQASGALVRGDTATNVVLALAGSAGAAQATLSGVSGAALLAAASAGVQLLSGATVLVAATLTNVTLNLAGAAAVVLTAAGLSVVSKKITNLAAPTVDTDAATKKYVDDKVVPLRAARIAAGATIVSASGFSAVASGAAGVYNLTLSTPVADVNKVVALVTPYTSSVTGSDSDSTAATMTSTSNLQVTYRRNGSNPSMLNGAFSVQLIVLP